MGDCHLYGVLSRIPSLNGTVSASLDYNKKVDVQSKIAIPYTIEQLVVPDEDYDYLTDVLIKPISYLQGYPKTVNVVEPLFDSKGNIIFDNDSKPIESNVVYIRKY